MLPDFERKLLRILYNYSGQRGRMPLMTELEVKTGKSRLMIREALVELERNQFIIWEDKSSTHGILIIEGWEPQEEVHQAKPKRTQPMTRGSELDYWTQY
ncbi:hypothetical protein [Paenibacillus sp. Marseille-Q4541]|uniref:hypothetical protein n=1 Tax=Paenibacillus sp. Marseille-Q4541 TaxID=2831522 RepID=UPI001BA5BB2F|nr:hypothetical protein [Paenibacillus sp. Marseille-Q4541]